jgi:hypothetical protein
MNWRTSEQIPLLSFKALVFQNFQLDRFILHHTTFPMYAKVDNSLNNASLEFCDSSTPKLQDLDDFSTEPKISLNAKISNFWGLISNYTPRGATWKNYGDDIWPNH